HPKAWIARSGCRGGPGRFTTRRAPRSPDSRALLRPETARKASRRHRRDPDGRARRRARPQGRRRRRRGRRDGRRADRQGSRGRGVSRPDDRPGLPQRDRADRAGCPGSSRRRVSERAGGRAPDRSARDRPGCLAPALGRPDGHTCPPPAAVRGGPSAGGEGGARRPPPRALLLALAHPLPAQPGRGGAARAHRHLRVLLRDAAAVREAPRDRAGARGGARAAAGPLLRDPHRRRSGRLSFDRGGYAGRSGAGAPVVRGRAKETRMSAFRTERRGDPARGKRSKYIFVTGGVVSSLGKGLSSASLGALLENRGLKITHLKLDPYINVDPGTMSPFQHGEVYVTDDGSENAIYIHLTLVPYISTAHEVKTKPTQHSVMKLREIGIQPDILLCRTDRPLSKEIKDKIALFCSVEPGSVFTAVDVQTIY